MGEKRVVPVYMYYVYSILTITVILTILRIVFYFYQDPFFSYNRDIDFRTLHVFMENGLINYYEADSIGGFRAYYLYHWYFIFFPVYILPIEVGVYVWDIFRVVASIQVAKKISNITENATDKIIFLILSGLGFFADAYLNNNNWLIQLLLFHSYDALIKDRKWLSGLLFSLATYKIIIIVFPILLIIMRKLKLKNLFYHIVPLGILCIPYAIFPNYFLSMYYNWTYMEILPDDKNVFLMLYLYSWQIFQTAQLMFEGLLILIFLDNFKSLKWRKRFRLLILGLLIGLNLTFPIVLWPLLYG